MAIERECPVYATVPIKTMGLGSDALMVMIVTLALTKGISGGFSMFIGWGAGYLVQRAANKSGLPAGFLQYKLAQWSAHPNVQRYAPFVTKFFATAWRQQGSLPPPGIFKRYSR